MKTHVFLLKFKAAISMGIFSLSNTEHKNTPFSPFRLFILMVKK